MRTIITRRGSGRTGQVLPLITMFLLCLLGMVALTIDVGRGWIMKRELQRSADAASLAGARYLPDDPTGAEAAARLYLQKNPLREGSLTQSKITFTCLPPGLDCSPYNAMKVDLKASMGTTFGKVVNVDTMNGGARSVAVSTQPKKYDIELVVDRSGSMGDNNKINNAKSAIQTFLKLLDPSGTKVGLVVFPPAKAGGTTCTAYDNYATSTGVWVTAALSGDYNDGHGNLNAGSNLIKQVNCLSPTGNTHYAIALAQAQAALDAQGRSNADDVIVFITDGAANIAPPNATADQKARPCGSAMDTGATIKGRGTRIFAIAYNVTDAGCIKDVNTFKTPANQPEGINPLTAIQAIASSGDYYYQPNPTSLSSIFKDIAGEITGQRTQLRDDDAF